MRKLIPVLLAVLLAFTACGDDGQTDDLTEPIPERTPVPTTDRAAPEIEIPEGDPLDELAIEDIEEGDGEEAEEGATVTVHYTGASWSTGEEFDSSWSRGEPATFPLSNVIEGWQEGIPGMQVGGRRQLIIPPELAYGEAGRPGIAPNETLVFVIDLLDVAG